MPELNSCADLKTGVHQGVTYHTNVLNNTVYSYECVSGFIPDGILAEGAVLCKEEHFKLAFTDTNGDFIPQPRCKINIGIGKKINLQSCLGHLYFCLMIFDCMSLCNLILTARWHIYHINTQS